jgi:hypothetical protein
LVRKRNNRGKFYAHTDVEAGTEKLHQSFVKTAYHGELFIQDGAEQTHLSLKINMKIQIQVVESDYKWVKSITDIQKDLLGKVV